ncbi:1,2-phenylacetyl-CoA epoxidase subunit PaaC [Aromatoleum petrolei]|uniref:Phenylacetate-CoA oxygenase subunit PaaC n=1 Tax=Aromatoleum petrolei TaxID=76116 RepID=A0ABX1MVS1_9RHOO|nr:1,2-phenylacetyl-CoA epoxidase subunit PaaC [Aromatoleum petrolei]NMF91326.1 phenylacetate-CoA oxygenase subunit PaaC [Aromatoleum petrolei]QTQ34425.1 1,2-phenylacetyl-CoA epoxidase, subunit C [Aromatoleum petrolei]
MLLDDKSVYLMRLGDNALVLSQRLSEWCGKGPAFEEDMALTNTALDLIGQARMWLSYAGEVEGRGRDEDALAFRRDAHEFTNLLLVEQPNGDYAHTLVRQFFFDVWHHLTLDALTRSADDRIADIASKAIKEVAYHLRRSSDLVVRLGDGSAESRRRMQDAVDALWMFTGEMFKADETEELLGAQGLACDPSTLKDAWLAMVREVFDEATLTVPAGEWMQKGGKQGRHGEHLGLLLAEMQFLQRAYPNASW